MGRVVVEHPDGRRLAVDEATLHDPSENPFNHAAMVHEAVGIMDRFSSTVDGPRLRPARPLDDHESLIDEGFRIVGRIAEHDILDPATGRVRVHAGAEYGLEGDT